MTLLIASLDASMGTVAHHMLPLLAMAVSFEIGTSAVIIRSADRIVVASDSKVIRSDDPSWSETICKIHVIGTTAVVSAGHRREPTLNYDLTQSAIAAVRSSHDFSNQVAHFERSFVPQLTRVLQSVRDIEPDYYHRHFVEQGSLAVQIAFVALNGDVAFRAFKPVIKDNAVHIVTERPTLPPKSTVFLGEDAAMFSLATILGSRGFDDPVVSARLLLEAAISSSPALVGPPIRILEIRKGKARWVLGGEGCEERRDKPARQAGDD
jgi:hypothetical protein